MHFRPKIRNLSQIYFDEQVNPSSLSALLQLERPDTLVPSRDRCVKLYDKPEDVALIFII